MESEIRLQTHSINLMHIMTGIIPQNAIDEINKHIDSVVIKDNKDSSDNLVGQINREKKSAQLDFPLDTEYGKNFKGMLDGCATSLLTEGYKRKAKADAVDCT